jgi:hypothetical protein
MLERIINITPGSDYKQSSRPSSRQVNAYRHLGSFTAPSNDSFLLSPATAFLASINWKLKKVVSENEKLKIVFSFDDFEFSTSFFIVELSQNQKIEYDISHLYESYFGKYDINTKVSAPITKENTESMQIKTRLISLSDFIKSVFKEGVNSNVNWAENYEVQKTFSHMEKQLQSEFDYINECLLNFLEKFLTMKLNMKIENSNARDIIALKFLQIKKI